MLQRARVRYYVKKPGNGRASWSILKDIVKPSGRRESIKVKDERIDAVNAAFKSGFKSFAECELELSDLINILYKKSDVQAPQFHEDNDKLFKKMWDKKYSHKDNKDLSSARNDFRRALEALGSVSLFTADQDDLQALINKQFKGNKQRRIVSNVNALLKFAGRDIELKKAKEVLKDPRHLRAKQFQLVLDKIEDPELKALYGTCLATGCRIGEAFSLVEDDLRPDNTVRIHTQMDRKLEKRETKNRTPRIVVPVPFLTKYIEQWVLVKNKKRFRKIKHANHVKAACKAALPDEPERWCTVHDLRHSFAIYLCSKGLTDKLVAMSIGDTPDVVRKYYSGFLLQKDSIEFIQSLLSK